MKTPPPSWFLKALCIDSKPPFHPCFLDTNTIGLVCGAGKSRLEVHVWRLPDLLAVKSEKVEYIIYCGVELK
jgi:hypothetical protein